MKSKLLIPLFFLAGSSAVFAEMVAAAEKIVKAECGADCCGPDEAKITQKRAEPDPSPAPPSKKMPAERKEGESAKETPPRST